jgi:hypothetical protein
MRRTQIKCPIGKDFNFCNDPADFFYTSCRPLIDVYCVPIYVRGRQRFAETLRRHTCRLDPADRRKSTAAIIRLRLQCK